MIRSLGQSISFLAWAALAVVGRTVWTLVRPGLRFLSAVFLVAAVIALTMDVTRWQTGAPGPTFQSLSNQIRAAAPATLDALSETVSATLHPIVWDPLIAMILSLPAWLVLVAISFLLGFVARERRHVSIFTN